MSRQYFDDPYGSSPRRTIVQPNQRLSLSSRQNVPSTSRDFSHQSTFQPNRERNPAQPPSYHYREKPSRSNGGSERLPNRTNISSNDRPHRRYQLEAPSTIAPVRHPQSHHDHQHHQDISRSSDRHHFKSQQPSSHHYPTVQSHRDDQDYPRYVRNTDQYSRHHHRSEADSIQPSSLHSNHRSVDVPSARHRSNPVRSNDFLSSHTRPIHQSSHPRMSLSSQPSMPVQLRTADSLLAGFLQSLFVGHNPLFHNDEDDDHSSLDPTDLIGFAWMMQRPGVLHIQFGDLSGLFSDHETPSVGLSDSDIERIPRMTYRKTSKSKSTDDKCAICLSEYKTGETVKRLQCKHFFHPECIDPWLKTSVQCPICRGDQTN